MYKRKIYQHIIEEAPLISIHILKYIYRIYYLCLAFLFFILRSIWANCLQIGFLRTIKEQSFRRFLIQKNDFSYLFIFYNEERYILKLLLLM